MYNRALTLAAGHSVKLRKLIPLIVVDTLELLDRTLTNYPSKLFNGKNVVLDPFLLDRIASQLKEWAGSIPRVEGTIELSATTRVGYTYGQRNTEETVFLLHVLQPPYNTPTWIHMVTRGEGKPELSIDFPNRGL